VGPKAHGEKPSRRGWTLAEESAQTLRMGEVHHLPPVGKELFIDDDGTALRATWHLDHGLVNFSIWRGDTCTETFPLSIEDTSRLIAYLADGLAAAVASDAPPSSEASADPIS
jgi:hypothetical protein